MSIGAGDNFNAGIVYSLIKYNIGYKKFHDLNEEDWKPIVETAIEFASRVCESYDNYLSVEYAEKYKLK